MNYPYPVYGTQGGGLVRYDRLNRSYVFVVKPNCTGPEVGDLMPEEWGLGCQVNDTPEDDE